ncbi:DUF1987 domain-containing protein [Luminiphilus sp.]|mgnify:FL=1|nr:DUF1987 domain-containing protein [Luminiphilus sp.]MDA9987397.1 DUF1987 domain-containing protein [Luminiphilus sp.]MDB0008620.1 DUF1987 domain-containing protein [Luminiphilus sp.]
MIFEQTQRTPYVEIGSNACVIRGECYPENISEWSGPVLEALEGAMKHNNGSFEVSIELYYFNSSSAKFLFDFFEYLEETAEAGRDIVVKWLYRAEDDTMLEAGEDFQEDLETCTYELVQIENEQTS